MTSRFDSSQTMGKEPSEQGGEAANGSGIDFLSAIAEKTFLEPFYAARVLETIGKPVIAVGSNFHLYEKGVWSFHKDNRNYVRSIAQNGTVLPVHFNTARRANALLSWIENNKQFPSERLCGFHKFDDLDAVLINVSNGVLRIKQAGDIDLLSHSPDHYFTGKLAVSYDSDAKAETFHKFLGEILPEKADQQLLQLFLGNVLLPSAKMESSLVAFGSSGTGKSTLAEAITALLGADLVTNLSLAQICDTQSYSLPRLRYAALNLGTELDSIALEESGNFKILVSGEPVEARAIYGSPFTMRTTAKLWFLSNNLPRFRSGTDAEQRRLRFLRFEHIPERRDPSLKRRLSEDSSGIFNWMLGGLVALSGLSELPRGGDKALDTERRFAVSNDPLVAFLEAECAMDPAAIAVRDEIKDAFVAFCDSQALPELTGRWFVRHLRDRFPQLTPCRPRNSDGSRVVGIKGLRLKTFAEKEENDL